MANERPSGESPRTILDFLAKNVGANSMVALRQDDSTPLLKPLQGRLQAGKYQLQGEIARGGVGVVLKGHDTHLGRDVALKVVREEFADHAEVMQRFIEEAQIGGQLQHPGIVPVYDIGLHEGRPFFTMKLIKGRTLAALLVEKGESRRRLLTIFEAVCQTMAYAHSRGVIHRDLKPANVMVGAFGEVQVVDWGMGKVLKSGGVEDERRAVKSQETIVATLRSAPGSIGSQSMVGSVMGTPGYMPPEQAMGDVEKMDERSDVFSLGAILAEILTGLPPYTGTNHEIIPRAARGELAECLARIDSCDADDELKALCRACLMPARQARPRNAGELAERVGGYLAALEDKARAAQVQAAEERVRAVEAKRKQRLTLALAASVLVTALVGGGGLWWVRSQAAAREARLREQFQAAVLEAGRAADPTEALSAAARARDLLAQSAAAPPASSIAELERVESLARTTQRRAQVERENAALLAELERARGPRAEDDRFSVDWQAVDRAYATAFSKLGLAPDSGTVEEAAAALSTRGDDVALAAALDDWTSIRRELGATPGATRLREVTTRLDGDPARGTLRAALMSEDTGTLEKLAHDANVTVMEPRTIQLLGQALMQLDRPGAARELLLRAHDAHPDNFLIALYLARAYYREAGGATGELQRLSLRFHLVARALRPGDYIANVELAQQYLNAQEYDRAEKLFRDLMATRPTDAILLGELALVMGMSGRAEEAESQFRAALRLDPEAAWVRRQLAGFLLGRERLDEAVVELERLIAGHAVPAWTYFLLAQAREHQGRLPEAREAVRRASELQPHSASGLTFAAERWRDLGDLPAATSTLRRAIEIDPKRARAHAVLGLALQQTEDLDGAAASLRRALALESDPKVRAPYRYWLGATLVQQRDFEAASVELEGAIEGLPSLADAHVLLGRTRRSRGRLQEARDGLLRAVALCPGDAGGLTAIGGELSDEGEFAGAVSALRSVIQLDPKLAQAHLFLGITLRKMGDRDGAVDALRRALASARDSRARAGARTELSGVLLDKGDLDGAIAEAEGAISEDPKFARAPLALARARLRQARVPEARAALRRALELASGNAALLTDIGGLMGDIGELAEALSALRSAVEMDPTSALALRLLGITLAKSGDADGAIAALRRSIAVERDPAAQFTMHMILGDLLLNRGDADGSLAAYTKAVEWGPENPFARFVLAVAKLRTGPPGRWPAVLAGREEPADWSEALAVAELAVSQAKDHAGALRLYRRGFEGNPAIMDVPEQTLVYNAACAAALVGATEHGQALKWLRAQLVMLDKALATNPGFVAAQLAYWKQDPDLRSVRDAKDLSEDFRTFWADLDALLTRAGKLAPNVAGSGGVK